jgi:hypothetical protein
MSGTITKSFMLSKEFVTDKEKEKKTFAKIAKPLTSSPFSPNSVTHR